MAGSLVWPPAKRQQLKWHAPRHTECRSVDGLAPGLVPRREATFLFGGSGRRSATIHFDLRLFWTWRPA